MTTIAMALWQDPLRSAAPFFHGGFLLFGLSAAELLEADELFTNEEFAESIS